MDYCGAFAETLLLGLESGMPDISSDNKDLDWPHLLEIGTAVAEGGIRDLEALWALGFVQACIIAADVGVTWDDLVAVNRKYDLKPN